MPIPSHSPGCFLFLASFLALPSSAQSLAGPLTEAELWRPEHVPFSFQLGDTPSAQLLPHWSTTARDGSVADQRVYTYTDPATKLQIEADVRLYPEFPGVVDWVLHFRNNGQADTPILDNVLPLRWSFDAVKGSDARIRHAKGSDSNMNDFQPLSDIMTPGGFDHMESVDGLSSSRNTLPFFNLQNGERGLIAAIGWTGDWKADFWYTRDARTIGAAAGMMRMHLRLHPGEEIRTPRIVLMSWSGGTWMDAQNRWRRLLLARYTPQEHGAPLRGPVMFGSWGSESIADKLAYIDWVHKQQVPLDVYGVDAGWYAESYGGEDDQDNPKWKPWYSTRGDWVPSPFYYPHGMEPLGDALSRDGIGFSLWVEPETAVPDRKAVLAHPDWYLTNHAQAPAHPLPPGIDPRLLNLGLPQARLSITETLSDLITRDKMTWYRQDFNIPPRVYWDFADAPDRIGMSEIRHIEGLYRMWDDLLAAHPGLHIDNCASGGRRIDIEMMSRSFVVWRSDYGVREPATVQAQTTGLAPWVPEVSSYESYTATAPWKKPGPYETARSLYLLRSGYDSGFSLSPGETGLNNPEWIAFVKRFLEEYRELQPFFYGDFYPVINYTLAEDGWTGWQWDRPEHGDGVVMLLRREHSPFATISLDSVNVDPNATYKVELRSGLAKQQPKRMLGSELKAMTLAIPSAPGSLLLLYQRVR